MWVWVSSVVSVVRARARELSHIYVGVGEQCCLLAKEPYKRDDILQKRLYL